MDKTGTESGGPSEFTLRSTLIMVASFLCNGIIFGIINTYSIIYDSLRKRLEESGEHGAETKAALVGSLAIGMTFFMSFVAGILTDKIGLRRTAFIGGILAISGLILSSFVIPSVEGLSVTFGLMFGIGASLVYTPSLVILGHYFKQYLGSVNGFVTSGSSVFTIILPYILDGLIMGTSLETTLLCMGILFTISLGAAFLFKPTMPVVTAPQPRNKAGIGATMRGLINVDIWKKKKYIIWAIAVPVSLTGYFVPYVHMVAFVQTRFPEGDGKILVMCIGVTSGLGRLIFGKVADHPRVDRILLQQISFLAIGVLTMCLTLINSFNLMIVVALAMGIFDGCFISIIGPIAFQICGPQGASQAIGFILGIAAIPSTFGPPLAGYIYSETGSYFLPFILAGIPPILGAIILCFMRCVNDEDEKAAISQTFMAIENGGTQMTVIANGDCNGKYLSPGDLASGMWAQYIARSYSTITPFYIPEYRPLLKRWDNDKCPTIFYGLDSNINSLVQSRELKT